MKYIVNDKHIEDRNEALATMVEDFLWDEARGNAFTLVSILLTESPDYLTQLLVGHYGDALITEDGEFERVPAEDINDVFHDIVAFKWTDPEDPERLVWSHDDARAIEAQDPSLLIYTNWDNKEAAA